MNHQAILEASRTLCTSSDYHERSAALETLAIEQARSGGCRRCANPVHADSRRKFCARHEREHAAHLVRTGPYCMMVQTELALWQSRAIALGQLSIDELVAQ